MEVSTHHAIVRRLCGEPVELRPGGATVRLATNGEMVADAQGLIHGGFLFGAADYAAMLAVNDPNVVLGSAEVRFLSPVRVGQVIDFEAEVQDTEGRKHKVSVAGMVEDAAVFRGTFACYVLDRYVLDAQG